jgi:hypothetical protein
MIVSRRELVDSDLRLYTKYNIKARLGISRRYKDQVSGVCSERISMPLIGIFRESDNSIIERGRVNIRLGLFSFNSSVSEEYFFVGNVGISICVRVTFEELALLMNEKKIKIQKTA